MPTAPPVTQSEACEFLCRWSGTEVADVEPAGEGTWSRCYAFEHAGRDLVARFGQHVEDFLRGFRSLGWRGSRCTPELA